MSYKLYDDADIQDIADAIREKNGSQDTYKVRQMGDAIRAINTSSGLTEEVKQALLDSFAHVAWVDEYGQDYYDALYDALYPPANLVSISAVYMQSGTVYDTDTLDSLKSDLVVTAHYDDQSTQTITTYTLSGTLTEGTSTITVLYGGKTTTFDVTVTENPIKWSYVYSDGDLIKLNGGVSWDATHSAFWTHQSGGSAKTRRTFVLPTGIVPLKETTDNSTFTDSIYYPIPIPSNATGISIAITPSTQYFGPALYTFDGTTYIRTNDVGWQQGSWSLSFTAGTYDYLTVACKQTSSGSSYTVEPTEFIITFTS